MEETIPNPPATAQEAFLLDDAALSLVQEIDAQMQALMAPLNATLNGALTLFARQHQLQGKWGLAANRKELIKLDE